MEIDTGVLEVNIDEIIPNRFQPRLSFDEKALTELSESIKQHGIIQPLVLRRVDDKYEIIAGERRYKAATMAGLTKVPAVLTNIDDNTSAEVALVENLQRKQLTAIEEAKSYKGLLDKGYLTQEDLAKRMGLSQSAISNKLRLLNLDEEVQDALLGEKISERHARALLKISSHDEQKQWLKRIIGERMTVRQVELEIKKLSGNEDDDVQDVPIVDLTPNIDAIKNNATDLNPAKETVTYNEFIDAPESVPQEIVPEVTVKTEEPPRKFFNFLEDEEVNMNAEEPVPAQPIQEVVETINEVPVTPVLEVTHPVEPTIQSAPINAEPVVEVPAQPVETVQEEVEVLDMPSLNSVQPPIEQVEVMTQEPTPPVPGSGLSPFDIASTTLNNTPTEATSTISYAQPVQEVPIVDPVTMIDRLHPEYEQQQLEKAGLDVNSAINTVRDYVKDLKGKGFNVDTEEIDLPTSYQIIININKDN